MAGSTVIYGPTDRPTNLSLKRGSDNAMDLKWQIALGAYSSANITWVDTAWVFQASKNMSEAYTEVREGVGHITADRIWIRDQGPNDGATNARSMSQSYDRTKYHPVTLDRYLSTVNVRVLVNSVTHPSAYFLDTERYSSITYTFKPPKPPEWEEDAEIDVSTGNVSCVLTAAEDDKEYEKYDTYYCVTRQDNFTTAYSKEAIVTPWEATEEGSERVETDKTPESQSLLPGQWIMLRFKAYSRGLAGNSATVVKTYVIAHPAKASIRSVTATSLTDPTAIVVVSLNTNVSELQPVDAIQLQRLSNTSINTAAAAAASQSWANVEGAVDDGLSSGLTDILGDARPDRGNHVWYRVASVHGSYTSYSDPVKADSLERAGSPVSDDSVVISSVTPGDDGESLVVVFGWMDDDSNNTEITWSDKEDSWNSTSPPSSYGVPDTWKDDSSKVDGMDNSAKLVIRDLSEGVSYYIKARRYMDDGNTVTYSDSYCTPASSSYPIAPATKPTSVVLSAPAYVKRGEDLTVSWVYGGSTDQKQWNLYRVLTDNGETTRTLLGSGEDAIGKAVVSAEKIGSAEDSIALSVSITTGGDWTESNTVTVSIEDPPEVTATTNSLLSSQPMQFYVGTDRSSVDLVAKVYSRGVFALSPNGEVVQVDGDVVWSEKLTPAWHEAVDGKYYAIVTLPSGLPFMNRSEYELQVVLRDTTTGFSSETSTTAFDVDWLHTAAIPGDGSTVTVSEDSKSARISPEKPGNWAAGDVYDLYRITSDSIDKIAEGCEYGTDAIDRFAPFGRNIDTRYRIVNRTKDGDVNWCDVSYELRGYQLRFDWSDELSLELPYNITINDSYTKNYEAHEHIDGTMSGHWSKGSVKKGSFTTKLPKVSSQEQATLLRQLGSYPGPVFVRTPDGSAYQANVTVKGLDVSYDNLLLGVSLDVEALTFSSSFGLAPTDFVVVEEPSATVEPEYQRAQILYWGGDVPASGDTFALNELPSGNGMKVDLTTSFDHYAESWMVPATNSGRTVTLGTFGSSLEEYLSRAAAGQNTQYILKAYYDIG